jgi:hypothetical protein
MPQQWTFDMRRRQRLFQQRVVAKVDWPDRQIVRGAPIGIYCLREPRIKSRDQTFFRHDRSAISDARIALPHFNNVTIKIADIAARFAVLGDGLRDELRSSAFP